MEKVTEEFRRYKVKMEIALKQKESELNKPISSMLYSSNSNVSVSSSSSSMYGGANQGLQSYSQGINNNGTTLPSVLEKALSMGNFFTLPHTRLNALKRLQ